MTKSLIDERAAAYCDFTERRSEQHGHLGIGGLVILPAEAPSTWHLESSSEMRHLHLYLGGSRDTCKSGQKILRQVTMFLLSTSLKPGFQKLDAIRISSTAHPVVRAQSFKTSAAGCATFFHDRMTSQFCT